MKRKLHQLIITAMLGMICTGMQVNAQSLLKDLNPGNESSGPEYFITVNGALYIITTGGSSHIHKLWKSDGTAANTVLVKDNLITTSVSGIITMLNVNNTLYFFVNKNGSATSATVTELWK